MTGYSAEELSSMTIKDLHALEDLGPYKKYFAEIMGGKEITSRAKILRKDGTKVDADFSIYRDPVGHTNIKGSGIFDSGINADPRVSFAVSWCIQDNQCIIV